MKIFEPLLLKFENPKWINDPELGLIDSCYAPYAEARQKHTLKQEFWYKTPEN
jgi:hypothetical protein